LLAGHPRPEKAEAKKTFAILWPNSWRTGVQMVAGYLTTSGNTQICNAVLDLRSTAQYGLSVQLITAALGAASVWTAVKWPMVGQYVARHDYQALQRVMRPRVWLHYLSFLFMAAVLILCGPWLLKSFGSGTQMLAPGWLCLMSLDSFLLMQFAFWGTLIFTQNRLPYLWPTVATNVLSLLLSLTLIHFTSLGLGALVLGPLLAGSLFNYWYWPPYSARSVGTTLFRFLFRRPGHQNAQTTVPG
jgi:Na+-driven multidrug efflux pump